MFRTPAKAEAQDPTRGGAMVTRNSGSPPLNVRKSSGDSGSPDSIGGLKAVPSRPKAGGVRTVLAAEASPPRPPKRPISDMVAEARSCVTSAKVHLSNSGNIKREIKTGVIKALDRLFQIVKEADTVRSLDPVRELAQQTSAKELRDDQEASTVSFAIFSMQKTLKKHMDLIIDNTARVASLNEALLERNLAAGGNNDIQTESIGKLLGEVQGLRQTTEATERKVSSLQETIPSYAEVLARPIAAMPPVELCPKHSVIVSSGSEKDTSDDVLGMVRETLEAKTTGLQVTRVQKVKNQKVVLSCASKAELKRVTDKIASNNKGLNVEEAKNKDPLVIIKNLLTFNEDAEILSSLRSQNKSLLGDLSDDEFRATVRYRRRARNPHENHVVLQVSPKLWQKLTAAKRVHIDLQYAAVQDQSPLVQCTRCLGYGHGRRLCTESADLCSYCAGPHLRANCAVYATGETATCRNCRSAKYTNISHNAFDGECPVRKRWDAIARSSVAYC